MLIFCVSLHAQPLLHRAAADGNLQKVKQLVKNGEKINGTDSLLQTPLMFAAQHGHTKVVKWLLKHGAKPDLQNYFGETALMLAVQKDTAVLVQLLLKKRSDPNLTDRKKWTALMLSKSAIVSALLVKKGAQVNYATPGSGITALMVAAEEGNLQLVKMLLALKADREKVTADGKKAIDFAVKNGHTGIVNLLQN